MQKIIVTLLRYTLMNMILQITETPSELSIAALLMKGGIVMVPIVLLSLATFYLLIERYLYIRSATKGRKDLMSHITRFLHHGDIKSAKLYADQDSSATGKIILSGLEHVGKPIKEIETMMESATNIEIAEMEKNMGYLGIIAGGLYEKMITSGSGLIVGVIAYTAYHFLQQKVSRFSLRIQKDVFEFMRSILSPAS